MAQRVLVVNSDVEALSTVEVWLTEARYEATTASSFVEARALLDTEDFDVLVADVRLGAFNGIHLVLLARFRNPRIRTIVTHGHENGSLEDESRRAGAHAYLRRPIARWALLSAVEAAIHADENTPASLRRWPRLVPPASLAARVSDAPARVVDLSYGGVCVEVAKPERSDLGSLLQLHMVAPSLSVRVRPVWQRESAHAGTWWVGAELAGDDPTSDDRWRSVVDSLGNQ